MFGCVICATTVAQTGESVQTAALETIVVSGEQPGPGLWKISKNGHVLWLLPTVSPLPKRMQWKSDEVADVIAQSGTVILPPVAQLSVKGGAARALFLLPALMGARNNPDKKKLVDVVPADLYARWQALKKTYIGRDSGIEKRRPIFAAQELYAKAIGKSDLDSSQFVTAEVVKLAKKSKVEVVTPSIAIKVEEPKAALREFSNASLEDIDCFRKTLDHLESDLSKMRTRGNAWATGDIEAIRSLAFTSQYQACQDAMLGSRIMEERGLDDLPKRLGDIWRATVKQTIDRHPVSFGMLPLGHASSERGAISALKDEGYVVQAPWEQDVE
jgi:uncharacterized protein YbaP (TraB family)